MNNEIFLLFAGTNLKKTNIISFKGESEVMNDEFYHFKC